MFDISHVPVRDALSQPFWDAARAHRLLIQRCPTTGAYQWFGRAHSLSDPAVAPEWVPASGQATLFSYTVIYRGGVQKTPYACVLVELEEGPLMLARCPQTQDLRIGMPMAVDFVPLADDLVLPVFLPKEA